MFRSLNFTTIITTITTTASIVVAITTRRSWWCRGIGGIITTIIITTTTIITASIAATIEGVGATDQVNRTLRVLFAFWQRQRREKQESHLSVASAGWPARKARDDKRGAVIRLLVSSLVFRRAVQVPVGAVEHRIR